MKAKFFKRVADPFVYLFWRAQIGILRACPPLCGVVIELGMNADRSRRLWIRTLFRVAVRAPRAVFLHLRDVKEKRVVLPRISVGVTTRCTLNCDKCIARIPELKIHRDIPAQVLVRDLRSLFSCVAQIYDLNISGGEAFLHPDLDVIIRACGESGKAGALDVTTNGTVIPAAKVLEALRETKASVRITRYPPALQPNVEQLKHLLKENGIPYVHEVGEFWFDTGTLGQAQSGSAKRRFSVCSQQLCLPYFDGKLYVCNASLALIEGGFTPERSDEYIDLRAVSPAEFRGQWRKLRKKRVISACSYCLGCSYEAPKVPVAVQRAR